MLPELPAPAVTRASGPDHRDQPRAGSALGGYLALTKPRLVGLLLVTAVPAVVLAAGGRPSPVVLAVVLAAGAMAAGAANVINCCLDRDLDALMRRTRGRPIPSRLVSPGAAWIFGTTLGATSLALLAAGTTPLAAGLALATIVHYDLVYTKWLKRTTPGSTLWGALCGAAPVLVGWAAVTGGIAPQAWAMAGIVFFWQPLHFYALGWTHREDYALAGIPALPVVATPGRVANRIAWYAWLTVIASLVFWTLGRSRWYGLVCVLAAVPLLVEAHRLLAAARSGRPARPGRLFGCATGYLLVVFVAAAVDALTS